MQWFEELTGLSPDNGNGTFEAMLAAVIGIAIILVAAYVISRRRTKIAR
jgi:LPXTG-motif cell wall-anchored protein